MATLLLADDSVTIQRVIELTFANESIRVVTAPDGHAATAMLEAERPDIVLADVGLPAVDGYTLAERLKRHPATAAIPVLLLTGAFEPIDETQARRTGCNGVLVKPFDPQRVVSLVKMLLAGQTPDDLWPDDMPRIDSAPQQTTEASSSRPHIARRDSLGGSGTMPLPSATEEVFEIGLDDLDLAFPRLDPVGAPSRTDPDSVSHFQRDIEQLRNVLPEPISLSPVPPRAKVTDGVSLSVPDPALIDIDGLDWDLPAMPAARIDTMLPAAEPFAPPPAPPAPVTPPANVPVLSTPWTPPALVVTPSPSPPPPPPGPPPPVVAPPAPEPAPQFTAPSLAAAFSALLAAERSQPASTRPPAADLSSSEAMVEAAVRRVASRLTGEVDRLVREELARLKR